MTVLLHLFTERQLICEKSADMDDNGLLQVTDALYSLAYLVTRAEPPPVPWMSCGVDPTDDDLTCASHGACDTAEGR